MNVTIEIDVQELVGKIDGDVDRLAEACARGIGSASLNTAGKVWTEGLAAGLHQRTGTLGGEVTAWQPGEDPLEREIGVPAESPAAKYAYLLGAQDVTIRPIGHKFLAIPIGANVTPAGVGGRLFGSPREIPQSAIAWRGRTVGVLNAAGEYDPLFALVTEVTIFGRDVLEPTVQADAPAIRDRIAEEIVAMLGTG